MEILINRYKTENDCIHSDIIILSETTRAIFQGLERLGYEIPKGTYEANYNHSPKFNRNLYNINVNGRQGIRIHQGNTVTDTTGCIIIGEYRKRNTILNSMRALSLLHAITNGQKIKITVNERTNSKSIKECIKAFIGYAIKCVRKMVK